MLNFGSFMFAPRLDWQSQLRWTDSARTIRFLRSMLRAAVMGWQVEERGDA